MYSTSENRDILLKRTMHRIAQHKAFDIHITEENHLFDRKSLMDKKTDNW